MAYCGKCGTQLREGAKFCPKCGQPTERNATNAFQKSETFLGRNEEQNKGQFKFETYNKWETVILLFIIGLIIAGLYFKNHSANSSKESSRQVESTGSSYNENVNTTYDNVAEVGYECGYKAGFQLGGSVLGDYTGDGSQYSSGWYTNYYPAPSTPEEKRHYKVFVDNFTRGFKDGKRAAKY